MHGEVLSPVRSPSLPPSPLPVPPPLPSPLSSLPFSLSKIIFLENQLLGFGQSASYCTVGKQLDRLFIKTGRCVLNFWQHLLKMNMPYCATSTLVGKIPNGNEHTCAPRNM